MATTVQVAVPGIPDAGDARISRRWLRSWKMRCGALLVGIFVIMAIAGPLVAPYDPSATGPDVLASPSGAHLLGTTAQGQDVFSQILAGARMSLEVGFLAALLSETLAILVGVTAGYASGVMDESFSLVTNVFLVIPVLPLQILIISYLGNMGWVLMAVVIGLTHWAHSARKLRAQTLSVRNRDFIEAARAVGESRWRIVLYEILPNEIAIIAAGFLFSVLGAIIVQTGLSFLGLGDISTWSWGAMLHWAERDNSMLIGAWWWYLPPGICLALVGMGLALLNLGIDELINPRLRAGGARKGRASHGIRELLHRRAVAAPGTGERVPVNSTEKPALLSIGGLEVAYASEGSTVRAVRGVDLTLRKGEVLGIAGESGSGKSTLAYAITNMLRPPGRVTAGHVHYYGDDTKAGPLDLLKLQGEELRQFRWEHVSVVFQAAMSSLNPVLTVQTQLTDTIAAHRPGGSAKARRDRAVELMNVVGLDPARLNAYPHQLSGGQRQRVVIAMALALNPRIVVMDEPTTALDVVVQRSILDQIAALRAQLDCTFIFITHDLSLLLEVADRIAVMYAGRVVEIAEAAQLQRSPQHPYTKALLGSFPNLRGERHIMTAIPGQPPDMRAVSPGCPYRPRCPEAESQCELDNPPLAVLGDNHAAACLLRQRERVASGAIARTRTGG